MLQVCSVCRGFFRPFLFCLRNRQTHGDSKETMSINNTFRNLSLSSKMKQRTSESRNEERCGQTEQTFPRSLFPSQTPPGERCAAFATEQIPWNVHSANGYPAFKCLSIWASPVLSFFPLPSSISQMRRYSCVCATAAGGRCAAVNAPVSHLICRPAGRPADRTLSHSGWIVSGGEG